MATQATLDEIWRQMILDVGGTEPADSTLQALMLAFGAAVEGSGVPVSAVLAATGDTTGVKDTAAIETAVATATTTGGSMGVKPGVYYIDAPIVVGPLGNASGTQPAPGFVSLTGAAHFGDYQHDAAAVTFQAVTGFTTGKYLFDYQQTPSAPEGPGGGLLEGFAVNCTLVGTATYAAGIRLQGPRGFTLKNLNIVEPAAPVSPGDTANGGLSIVAESASPTAGAYNHYEQVTVTDGAADGIYSNGQFTDTYLNCHCFGNANAQFHMDSNFQGAVIGGDYEGGLYGFLIETQVAATIDGVTMFQAPATTKNAIRINGGSPGTAQTTLAQGIRVSNSYFTNTPGGAVGAADGAVVYLAVDSTYIPRITFEGCTFAAGPNTTYWVYTDAGIVSTGHVTFIDCDFLGTPATGQLLDQSQLCTFINCRGITPPAPTTFVAEHPWFDNAVRTAAASPGSTNAILNEFVVRETQAIDTVLLEVGTQSGNIDVGIYSVNGTTWTRLSHAGSTACPASGQHAITIPTVILAPGTYYVALVADNGTATFEYWVPPLVVQALTSTLFTRGFTGVGVPLPATSSGSNALASSAIYGVLAAKA